MASLLVSPTRLAAGFTPSQSSYLTPNQHQKQRSEIGVTTTISTAVEKIADLFGNSKADRINDEERNSYAQNLLSTCIRFGQVGSKLTQEQRSEIDGIAISLSAYSDDSPAKLPLIGDHDLIYSASPGGSSGAIGPLTGKVTQSFLDDVKFINRVELFHGVVKFELNAEREVLDGSRIRVIFRETAFFLFGNEVARKDVKGSGVWKYEFGGIVKNDENKEEKLFLRVLKTPSTFVIVQRV
ncbi:hypothetical protein ACHAXS_006652 [Conticribra weissflogii]